MITLLVSLSAAWAGGTCPVVANVRVGDDGMPAWTSLLPPIPAPPTPVRGPAPTAPLTVGERLELARSLAAEPERQEEALDALLALLSEPETTVRAHLALVALTLGADPRPGWLDVYARLGAHPRTTPSEAAALRVRAAEALTWVPAAHEEARAALVAAVVARPADAELAWHLGRAHLVLGEIEAAERVFSMHAGDARFDAGARVAALGRPDAADPLADRIGAAAAAGFPDLALRLAPREDPAHADPGAWAAHAAVLLGRGRAEEALEALAGSGDDPRVIEARTRALLALGRVEAARASAAGVGAAERRVRAVSLASEAPDEAWALASDEPAVVLARADALVAAGRSADAVAMVAPFVVVGPAGGELLEAYTRAALAAGRGDAALDAWRAAVTRASGPEDRARLAHGLADTYARAAEVSKRDGDARGAAALYRVAVASEPRAAGQWAGLAGALWASGALEAAQGAYLRAASVATEGAPAVEAWLGSAADLAALRGRPEEAVALLRDRVTSPALAARLAVAEAAAAGASVPAGQLELLRRAAPEDAALVGVLARAHAAAGRPEAALSLWDGLARVHPSDPAAHVGVAEMLLVLGRVDAASLALDHAIEAGVDATALAPVRAAVLRARGDALRRGTHADADALAAYVSALAIAPDGWTWAAVGGLYLAHGQPRPALAAFRAARALDPANPLAGPGEVRALVADGDLDAAHATLREMADPGGAIAAELAAATAAAVVARAELLLALGERDAARELLAPLDGRARGVAALRAALDLAAGDAAAALEGARGALQADTSDARAAAVLVDAAAELGELDRAAGILDGLAGGPGAPGDRFVLELAGARVLAERGAWARARQRLERLEGVATPGGGEGAQGPRDAGDPDRLALLGGAWLALGETSRARVVYARALELRAAHAPSVEGLAAALVAEGRPLAARACLGDAWARTRDPVIGAALARHLDVGGASSAVALREALRDRAPTSSPDPLPVLSGLPDDAPKGASSQAHPVGPAPGGPAGPRPTTGGAMFGLLSRPGEAGANRLLADAVHAHMEAALGPWLSLEASALAVGVGDGTDDRFGAAGVIGLSTVPTSRLRLKAGFGTSPVGLSDVPYATWLGAVGWRAGRAELGVETLRAPVTDSLASWGGAVTDGVAWGRAYATTAGAWASWTGASDDLGLRVRIGSVSALGAAPTGRRELSLWAGHRLGALERGVRLGLTGALLGHDGQLDAFAPGDAGAFTPLGYRAGGARVDGDWGFGRGAAACGGASIGVQHVEGEGSAFFAAGTFAAASVHAGGSMRIGRGWWAGVGARWEVVGPDWSEQVGGAWVSWSADATRPKVAASPVYGAALSALPGC